MLVCQECNEEEEINLDYHLSYHQHCRKALQNEHSAPKPKIEGASFFCSSHENQKLTTYCKKCDSYLCFDCQMDHFDHAKGNFVNAGKEILF